VRPVSPLPPLDATGEAVDVHGGEAGRAPAARGSRARAILRALRPHHWLKNLTIVVPIAAAHRWSDRAAAVATLLAFAAFSLVASAGYVVNDLADADADRAHPRKRARPFAARQLSAGLGVALVAVLLAAAAFATSALPRTFAAVLGAYLLAAVLYTFLFRRRPGLDVIVLAGLYTARIFGGGFAAGIPVSEWLTGFSMFFFLSLAFLKRAGELIEAPVSTEERGYRAVDRETILALGASSGLMSIVVLTLYLASPEVRRLYAHPARLWAVCPLLVYWFAHLWLRAGRGSVRDDPLVVALTDRVTWIVAVLGAAVVAAAL
jgi:4-hydroxybenzoate polyprenyltransferase